MILIKELKLNNFLSHENTKISFGENEKILIDGKSGSGKSSITEAILWCLYGKGRSDNRSLIKRGTKNATVSIKFNDGQLDTLITRTVSSTGKNTLLVTQNTGSRKQFLPIERIGLKDTQDWIEKEFLKASYELFTNSIAYPQENENSFVKANASKRKDLLLEIVRAGNFDELYDKTRKTIIANELENAVAVSKIENLESVIKNSKDIADKYDFYKLEVGNISTQITTSTFVEKELENQMNNVSNIVHQITDKKAVKQMVVKSLATIEKQLESDRSLMEEHKTMDIETARRKIKEAELLILETERIEKELKENTEAQTKINIHLTNKPSVFDYIKEIETINTRLIPLIKDSGKCPAGDACPFVIPIMGQIDFLTQQITEKTEKSLSEKKLLDTWEKEYVSLVPTKDVTKLYAQLKEMKERINDLLKSRELITVYETFEKTLTEIQIREGQLKEEKAKLIVDLSNVDTSIQQLESEFVKSDSNKLNIELSNIRLTIQQLQKTRDEASSNMTLATKAKDDIKEASTGLVGLRNGVIRAYEEKESLELLKEALSPRGIKAVVVDYIVPQLEERINKVLGQMSDFRIKLDTQKPTADEEGVKEGLFITIINDLGVEMPYESYSGGEKIKITIAISEALASLMSDIGFRLMDENIISLDKESTESFVEVLTKLQDKFPQLLAISHLQEVKDIFEKKITIIKNNGISQII